MMIQRSVSCIIKNNKKWTLLEKSGDFIGAIFSPITKAIGEYISKVR